MRWGDKRCRPRGARPRLQRRGSGQETKPWANRTVGPVLLHLLPRPWTSRCPVQKQQVTGARGKQETYGAAEVPAAGVRLSPEHNQLLLLLLLLPEHDFRITFVTQINLGPHIRYHLVPLRESQKATWALAKPFYVFSVDIFYGTPDHEVSMKRWRSPLRKGRDVQHREVTGGWRGAQSCPASHPSILFLNQPLASVNFQLICKVTVCFVEIIQSIFAKCG